VINSAEDATLVRGEERAEDRDVVEHLQGQLEHANETIDGLRNERKRMQRAIEKAESTIAELTSKTEALSEGQKQMQADHRREVKALCKELKQVQNDRDNERRLRVAASDHSKIERELAEEKSAHETTKEAMYQIEAECREAREKVQADQQVITGLRSELEEARTEAERRKREYDRKYDQVTRLEAEIKRLQGVVEGSEIPTKARQTNDAWLIKEANDKVTQLGSELEQLRNECFVCRRWKLQLGGEPWPGKRVPFSMVTRATLSGSPRGELNCPQVGEAFYSQLQILLGLPAIRSVQEWRRQFWAELGSLQKTL
jgi:chromosome segregation ATPase